MASFVCHDQVGALQSEEDMTSLQHAIADEDRLRAEDLGGDERARLAESIAEEFRV